jgi:P27 family predicted phage terminase small subunit
MLTGRPPKPTALKLLHGDRPDRINASEPQPRDVRPEPPDDLSDAELAEWHRVVIELHAMGLAFAADRDIIRAYCSAVVAHAAACRMLFTAGVIIRGRDGQPVRNPAAILVRQQADLLRHCAHELGLTPAARVRFGTTGTDQEDAAAQLLSS